MTTSTAINAMRLARAQAGLPQVLNASPSEAEQRNTLLSQIRPADLADLEQQRTHGATPTDRSRVSLGNFIDAMTTQQILAQKKAAQKALK